MKLERVANFREVSGYRGTDGRPLAAGRVFRSGHWGHASEADCVRMRSLGIRLVVDFRSAKDIAVDGADRLPPGVESLALPMDDPSGGPDIRELIERSGPDGLAEHFGDGRAEAMMTSSAAKLVTARRREYGSFLKRLALPEAPPVLFHCSAGKDRAGWAGSILLLALGVDEEQVVAEYLKSNRAAAEVAARAGEGGGDLSWQGVLKPLLEVRREYFQASLGAVREHYGGIDGYLAEGLGLAAAEREGLRKNWLA